MVFRNTGESYLSGGRKMTGTTAHKTQIRSLRETDKVKWITVTAIFMGMNIALCAFGIPVPGGHLYLNDVVICTASLLLDPFAAFIVGGIGAFLGDFIFYLSQRTVCRQRRSPSCSAISFWGTAECLR